MVFIGIIKVKLKTKSGVVIKPASPSIYVLCTAADTSGFSHFVRMFGGIWLQTSLVHSAHTASDCAHMGVCLGVEPTLLM